MSSTKPHRHSIEWLRDAQGLRTRTLPEDQVPETAPGVVRIRGHRAGNARPSRLGFPGLILLLVGTVLGLLNLPSEHQRASESLNRIGAVMGATGLAGMAYAEQRRRRQRVQVVAELRTPEHPPDPAAMATLAAESRGAEAWMVYAGPLPADALEAAHAQGVRSFEVPRRA